MKKYLIVSIVSVIIFASFSIPHAHAQIPFGGIVNFVQPCDTGLLLYVLTAKGEYPFMWIFGELPFLMYIPPHIGQFLLGDLAAAPVPCALGVVPYGVGAPIIFHGESI